MWKYSYVSFIILIYTLPIYIWFPFHPGILFDIYIFILKEKIHYKIFIRYTLMLLSWYLVLFVFLPSALVCMFIFLNEFSNLESGTIVIQSKPIEDV